jgi:hypothetical protein
MPVLRLCQHAERHQQQLVAEHEGLPHAQLLVQRRNAAALGGFIDHVVMKQRCGVQQFDSFRRGSDFGRASSDGGRRRKD